MSSAAAPPETTLKRRTASGAWPSRKRGGLPIAWATPLQHRRHAPLRRQERRQAVDCQRPKCRRRSQASTPATAVGSKPWKVNAVGKSPVAQAVNFWPVFNGRSSAARGRCIVPPTPPSCPPRVRRRRQLASAQMPSRGVPWLRPKTVGRILTAAVQLEGNWFCSNWQACSSAEPRYPGLGVCPSGAKFRHGQDPSNTEHAPRGGGFRH